MAYVKENVTVLCVMSMAVALELALLMTFAIIAAFARARQDSRLPDGAATAARADDTGRSGAKGGPFSLDFKLSLFGTALFGFGALAAYFWGRLAPVNWLGLVGGHLTIVLGLDEGRFAKANRLRIRCVNGISSFLRVARFGRDQGKTQPPGE